MNRNLNIGYTARYIMNQIENKPIELVSVGKILVDSWGYDQTNIDYAKVLSISPSGKSAMVVNIGQKFVEGSEGFMSESVLPNPDSVRGEPYRVLLRFKDDGSLRYAVGKGHSFWLDDGKSSYQSHYA